MSHEMSKKHQEQVAEKTAILVNHAFRMGIQAERNRIIELIPEYMKTVLDWGHETASKELIELIKREDKND